jgi:hypothetical protein
VGLRIGLRKRAGRRTLAVTAGFFALEYSRCFGRNVFAGMFGDAEIGLRKRAARNRFAVVGGAAILQNFRGGSGRFCAGVFAVFGHKNLLDFCLAPFDSSIFYANIFADIGCAAADLPTSVTLSLLRLRRFYKTFVVTKLLSRREK